MTNFKKTLFITDIIETVYGYDLKYEYLFVKTNSDEKVINTNYSELLSGKKYIPQENDKLYFLPGCNIPRFKLKDYLAKYKIAPVKYRVRANVVITGPDAFLDLFETINKSSISFNDFNKWINLISPLGDLRFSQLKYDMEKVNENFEYVIFSREIFIKLLDINTPFNVKLPALKKPSTNIYEGIYSHFNIIKDEESFDILKAMLDPNSRIYNQDDILSELNTELIIDDEIYQNLTNLFNSTDQENIKLAMEIMSNCDFKKSAVNILLLIKNYGSKIYTIKNKNHVNFKALLTYFDIRNVHNLDIDDIIESLIDKKLLTHENLQLFLPEVIDTMNKRCNFRNFSINNINFSDVIKNAIGICEDKKQLEDKSVKLASVGELRELIDIVNKPFITKQSPITVLEYNENKEPLVSSQSVILDFGSKEDDVFSTDLSPNIDSTNFEI